MSKRKKQSANLNKQSKVKREIIQLEDCSKNDECGVSVVDDVKVIVFYNGPNYKVKISIPKRSITKKILKVQNSKFDLYIRFEDTDYRWAATCVRQAVRWSSCSRCSKTTCKV